MSETLGEYTIRRKMWSLPYRRKWAVRTVRDGKVRIFGHDFIPDDRWAEYDGRFEGKRYLFGLYTMSVSDTPDLTWYERFVYMWGSERYAKKGGEECADDELMLLDNMLPWAFWYIGEEETP